MVSQTMISHDLAERIAKVKQRALDARNHNRVTMDLSPSLILAIIALVEQQGQEIAELRKINET